jgi:hypothetical protein
VGAELYPFSAGRELDAERESYTREEARTRVPLTPETKSRKRKAKSQKRKAKSEKRKAKSEKRSLPTAVGI